MTDLHALVAPYALDAIDELDRQRFDHHLVECETCSAQLGGLAAAAAVLATSEATTPPAHLRSQILSMAATVPQYRSYRGSRRVSKGAWRRILPGIAVAAALLVPVAGALSYTADRDNGRQESLATTAVSSVLAAPDADTRSESVVGGGSVRVVTSHARGSAIVAADRLPALTRGKTYQVWTLAPSGAVSRGTFASSTVVTADRIGSADRVAVTVEPTGGSARPTSLPVAVLQL